MNGLRKSKGLRRVKQLCWVLVIMFIMTACSTKRAPKAEQGVLDLRNWVIGEQGSLALTGEWEFYWEQYPSEGDGTSDPVHVTVPSSWTRYEIDPPLPSAGYATYQLRIIVNKQLDTDFALKIPEAQTALRLYVNDELVAQQGIAGEAADTTQPAWHPQTVMLPPPDEMGEYTIAVEVANFDHRKGGLDEPYIFGTQHQINRQRELNILTAFMAFGSLVTIGVYHVSLNVTGAQDKQSWWFSMLCFAIALRVWVTDEILLSVLIPNLPWVWFPRLDYSLIAIAVIAFAWYYRALFPKLIPTTIVRIVSYGTIAYILVVICTPGMWFTHVLPWYHSFLVLCIIFYLATTIKAVLDRLPHALASLIGFTVVGILVINDVLLNNEIIHTMYLSQYGIVLFVFIQAYVQTYRFSSGFRRKEALSLELEQRVLERTMELHASLAKLRNVNEMLEISQQEALQARDDAERTLEAALASTHAKTEFMANVSHQLRTPLNAILGFTELMLMSESPTSEADAALWVENLRAIQESSYQLFDLVENVLLMTESETGQMGLRPVVSDFWQMLDGLDRQFGAAARNKGLAFDIERASNVPQYIRTDTIKLHRVLKELLTNAVKFTPGGRVHLLVKARRSLPFYLIIEVSDTGPGFSQDEQSAVFDTFRHVSKGDIYKQGLGLGLPLCRRLVRILGGELTYITQEHHGTVFRFQIPIETASLAEYLDSGVNTESVQSPDVIAETPGPRRLRGAALYVQGRNIMLPAPESLPKGWTQRIQDALAELNVSDITNLIYDIREGHQEYADTLLALVEKNDYDTLKALVGNDLSGR